ncbi:MAG: hypothetical protein JWL76_1453 [Thermoleophilia bacterium]|nr:hypothetical protein [Thermoleophilia bacterium]
MATESDSAGRLAPGLDVAVEKFVAIAEEATPDICLAAAREFEHYAGQYNRMAIQLRKRASTLLKEVERTTA